ncbi:MAG: hypothetical protein V1914_00510 [archaeon]
MKISNGRFKKGSIPWNKNSIRKVCLNCGKEFFISKSRNLEGRGKFDSIKCKKGYKYKLAKEFFINGDMAELIGIIIGDGCISRVRNRNDYRIQISGNKIEDKFYMEDYLPSLVFRCLKIKSKPFLAKNGALILQFQSEPFRIFLHSLGICSPKAKTVCIPEIIKSNRCHLKRCIRGIADTDFTLIFTKRKKAGLNYYPRICAQFASESLVKDLETSLHIMGFTLNVKYNYLRNDKRGFKYTTNFINLDGPINLNRWIDLIGFSNMRIKTRYQVWQEYKHLKPKSTISERIALLEGARG